MKSQPDAIQQLENLLDASVEAILAMTDEEIRADAIEHYGSAEAADEAVRQTRKRISVAIARACIRGGRS